jgi:hypothetical protein
MRGIGGVAGRSVTCLALAVMAAGGWWHAADARAFTATKVSLSVPSSSFVAGHPFAVRVAYRPSSLRGLVTVHAGTSRVVSSSASGGTTTLSIAGLPRGYHSLWADFSPSGDFAMSTSGVTVVLVSPSSSVTAHVAGTSAGRAPAYLRAKVPSTQVLGTQHRRSPPPGRGHGRLPFTGLDVFAIALIGLLLIAIGWSMNRSARTRTSAGG